MTTYFDDFNEVKIIKKSKTHYEVWKSCYFHVPPMYSECGPVGGGNGYDWLLDKVFKSLNSARIRKRYLLNLIKDGNEVI